ncbi:MAG: zf-TFIIB domain-containing protein [Thiovulaceae bacterium]|nr:zf-TFIIB domain-containing protein [Sulfurimonadaceae bacterium]
MKCPVCKDVDLVMSERQGVEIDYCPSCRGVWLDRGELDKIIEKSTQGVSYKREEERGYKQEHRSSPYDSRSHEYGYHKKKKESFLSDLFDF